MNSIEELLKTHCPNGVEYKPLYSVTIWDKQFNGVDKAKQPNTIKYYYYLADDLKKMAVQDGDIKLLTTNETNIYTKKEFIQNNENIKDMEIVCIPWGGNPIVQYYKGKFVTADNRIATSINTSLLNNKFLYYVLLNQIGLIGSFYRGSGIKHPDMSKVLNIQIPIPPLIVQEKIVSILDTFTELEARKKQYAYYREKLLSFDYLDSITGGH